MIPIKSNTNKENCVPVSSNCVIWQGPNLPCIGICTGDSVSDVVYRVAVEVCNIKDSFGFTDVDLTCLLNICSTVPEPQKTLSAILNLIISKVCCLSDITNDIIAQINANPTEPELTLASCFHVTNAQGVPLTKLPHTQYTLQIGLKVCEIYNIVYNDHEPRIVTLEGDVAALQAIPVPTLPQVTTDCITGPGVVPGIPADMDAVLNLLESEYCQIVAALGPATDIVKTKAAGCAPALFANPTSLSDSTRSLSSLYPGQWNAAPANLSQALVNLWITVCDIRGAVKLIQDTCCKVSCDTLVVDFDVKRTSDSQGNTVLKLFFYPKTNLPSTWFDCNQAPSTPTTSSAYSFVGNQLSIMDEAGHEYIAFIPLRKQDLSEGILNDTAVTNTGYSIPLSSSSLDEVSSYTITSNICVTDGTTTCVKCINKNVPYVAPKCDYCEIQAKEEVTIVYQVCTTTATTTTTTTPTN